MVKGNHKRSPDVEDENVPDVWEIEVGVDVLVTIGDQDKLIKEKVDAILNNKSFRKKKPLEGEKKHKSRTEERAPLSDCKQKYCTLHSAYIDKIKWFKSLASQLGGEIEETNPVDGKEAPDNNNMKKTLEIEYSADGSEPKTTATKTLTTGQTKVNVLKTKNVEATEMFGKGDPYVEMNLVKQVARSATVNSNHDPEMNFEATLMILIR